MSVAPPKPLSRLLRYARPHRRELRLATAFSILNKLFDLAPPVLIGAAVDIVVAREDSFIAGFGFAEGSTQLWILAGLTLAIWAGESVFEYLFALRWRGLAQTVEHELRMDVYRHVQSLELAYFEDRSTGGLLAVLNDDINQLERFLDNGANELIQLITTVLVVGSLFMIAVPSVAWMTMLPMPFVVWGSVQIQRRLEPRYTEVRVRVGELSGQLANNFGGIATIKSFTTEAHEAAAIEASSRAYAAANTHAIRLSSAFVPVIRMIIVLGFVAILVYGGAMALDGELNVGVYSVLVFMTQRLLWPLTRLGTMLDQYQRAMASTTRALDLLDTEAKIRSGDQVLEPGAIRGEVQFDAVDFDYGSGASAVPVLRGLSVDIAAGQTVAFVGATGAGKSTIIKLLLRFYDVSGGSVRLDGVDVRALELASLRGAIGLVSQEVFLFHGSVRENIAYGSFDATDEAVIAAAKAAEAHAFILALPQGYDTVVGERGQKLSGGQRQRLSIARAVLRDPPVLILDEATSSVDNETEAAIQRSLERITRGRTTIVIAHRLSTVRSAERTFVLERGQIIEEGSHDELVAAEGFYANLWRVQTGVARNESPPAA